MAKYDITISDWHRAEICHGVIAAPSPQEAMAKLYNRHANTPGRRAYHVALSTYFPGGSTWHVQFGRNHANGVALQDRMIIDCMEITS